MWRSDVVGFFALVLGVAFGPGLLVAAASHGLLPVTLPAQGLMVAVVWSPGVIALALVAGRDGRAGVRALLSKVTAWRAPLGCYLVALLLPAVVNGAALLLSARVGGAGPDVPGALPPELQVVPLGLLPLAFLLPSLAEEIGWRGYALPRLQRTTTALGASVLLGVVWAVWHLPLALLAGSTHARIPFGWYVLGTVAIAVVFTWVYNSSAGSLVPVTLLHASVQVTNVLLPVLPAEDGDATVYRMSVLVTLLVAAVVVVVTGPRTLALDSPGRRLPSRRRVASRDGVPS